MQAADDSAQELLKDARILGLHLVRTGTLPPDSTLFEEAHQVATQFKEGKQPSLATLSHEVDRAVKAIRPATLEDLRRKARPRSPLAKLVGYVTPLALAALTLTLTLYLAFQSSELHKAGVALNEYQQLESEKPEEKLYQAWKMFRFERVINITSPPFTQLDDYQHLVQEFRRLVERRAAILMLFSSAQAVNWMPSREGGGYEIDASHNATLKPAAGTSTAAYPEGLPLEPTAAGPRTGHAAAPARSATPIAPLTAQPVPMPCESAPVAKAGQRKLAAATEATFEDLNTYVQGIDCFVSSLRISVNSYNYPLSVGIYQTRLKVHLLTTWLLPGLYGLLGACVFLLRDIVFIREGPSARYQPRVINLLSLVLRIALGGLAGIIIGWFSVPGSFASPDAGLSITSIPFGLAFLAGFSIETLFTLLDRFNKAISDPLRRNDGALAGETDGDTPPVPAGGPPAQARAG